MKTILWAALGLAALVATAKASHALGRMEGRFDKRLDALVDDYIMVRKCLAYLTDAFRHAPPLFDPETESFLTP